MGGCTSKPVIVEGGGVQQHAENVQGDSATSINVKEHTETKDEQHAPLSAAPSVSGGSQLRAKPAWQNSLRKSLSKRVRSMVRGESNRYRVDSSDEEHGGDVRKSKSRLFGGSKRGGRSRRARAAHDGGPGASRVWFASATTAPGQHADSDDDELPVLSPQQGRGAEGEGQSTHGGAPPLATITGVQSFHHVQSFKSTAKDDDEDATPRRGARDGSDDAYSNGDVPPSSSRQRPSGLVLDKAGLPDNHWLDGPVATRVGSRQGSSSLAATPRAQGAERASQRPQQGWRAPDEAWDSARMNALRTEEGASPASRERARTAANGSPGGAPPSPLGSPNGVAGQPPQAAVPPGSPAAAQTHKQQPQVPLPPSPPQQQQQPSPHQATPRPRQDAVCTQSPKQQQEQQGSPAAQQQQQQQAGAGKEKEKDKEKDKGQDGGAAVQWVIRPGPPVESVYEMGNVLGKGSFGVVRAATHRGSGSSVAVKSIRKSLLAASDVAGLRREVEILHHLAGHPHISQLLGVFEDSSSLHLVLELYQGGDLFDAIIATGRHSERAAADVMRTVLTAIAYCHAMGVAHRDIKPENFMLTAPPTTHPGYDEDADALAGPRGEAGAVGSRLKLIDFGLSVFCTDDAPMSETVGTSYYVAPEVLGRKYSRSADVWSAGVILHILLAGYAPFDGRNDGEILRAVQQGRLDLTTDPIWGAISRDGLQVLKAMLERNPEKRATADQLLAMPWLGRSAAACTAPAAPLPGVVSERMRRFARMNSFKKEARRVVAGLMRAEEVAGLMAQFQALDADRDGKLSVQELAAGLGRQELRGPSVSGPAAKPMLDERELRRLVERTDLDGDGMLDASEFLGAALPTATLARQAQAALQAMAAMQAAGGSQGHGAGHGAGHGHGHAGSRPTSAAAAAAVAASGGSALALAFQHFDADGSGYITVDELRGALATHHPDGDGPDVRALLRDLDTDGDGRLSYAEFLSMLAAADEEEREGQEGEEEEDEAPRRPRKVDRQVSRAFVTALARSMCKSRNATRLRGSKGEAALASAAAAAVAAADAEAEAEAAEARGEPMREESVDEEGGLRTESSSGAKGQERERKSPLGAAKAAAAGGSTPAGGKKQSPRGVRIAGVAEAGTGAGARAAGARAPVPPTHSSLAAWSTSGAGQGQGQGQGQGRTHGRHASVDSTAAVHSYSGRASPNLWRDEEQQGAAASGAAARMQTSTSVVGGGGGASHVPSRLAAGGGGSMAAAGGAAARQGQAQANGSGSPAAAAAAAVVDKRLYEAAEAAALSLMASAGESELLEQLSMPSSSLEAHSSAPLQQQQTQQAGSPAGRQREQYQQYQSQSQALYTPQRTPPQPAIPASRARRHSAAAAMDLNVRVDGGGSGGSSRHASPMAASPQHHHQHHRSSQQHPHHAAGPSPQLLHSPRSRVTPLVPSSPHASRLGPAQPHTGTQSQQQERQASGWFYSPGAGSPSSGGGGGAKRGVNPRGVELSAASASYSGTRPSVDLSAASATTAAQFYAANPRASRLSPHELLVAAPAGGSGSASPARAQRQGGGGAAAAGAWSQPYQRIDQEPYSPGCKAGRGTGGGAYEDAGPPGSAAMAEMLPGAFSEPLASMPGPMAAGRASGPSRLGGGGQRAGAGDWGGAGAPPPWEAAAAGVRLSDP